MMIFDYVCMCLPLFCFQWKISSDPSTNYG